MANARDIERGRVPVIRALFGTDQPCRLVRHMRPAPDRGRRRTTGANMDELLRQRYGLLFGTREVTDWPILATVKRRIREKDKLLRPDAALCLLILYEGMIVRAYSGPLAPPQGDVLPSTSLGTQSNFGTIVEKSLDFLLGEIAKFSTTDASSHDVIKAIDSGWKTLSEYFQWG